MAACRFVIGLHLFQHNFHSVTVNLFSKYYRQMNLNIPWKPRCDFYLTNASPKRLIYVKMNRVTGSNRVFGTVVEKRCIFLVDTSGSMDPYMEELKRELASLIWEQIHRNRIW